MARTNPYTRTPVQIALCLSVAGGKDGHASASEYTATSLVAWCDIIGT
jgi:hypothetical protein